MGFTIYWREKDHQRDPITDDDLEGAFAFIDGYCKHSKELILEKPDEHSRLINAKDPSWPVESFLLKRTTLKDQTSYIDGFCKTNHHPKFSCHILKILKGINEGMNWKLMVKDDDGMDYSIPRP